MYCHQCGKNSDFITIEKTIEYPVKDLFIPVKGKVAVCAYCKMELFHREYDEANQTEAFNLYREKKGIVFPEEIIAIRKKYKLSQRDYSKLLGFGEITIARYERGSLPTPSQNQHIKNSADPALMLEYLRANREKIDPEEANRLETLLHELIKSSSDSDEEEFIISEIKGIFHQEPDLFTGNKKFNLKKFAQMVLFFAIKERPYITKLNKLMFYADYYYFKLNGFSISGSKYLRHNYGPVPDKYQTLYSNLKEVEVLENEFGQYVYPEKSLDISIFNNDEINMLHFVYEKFKHLNAKQISDYSHEEEAWLKTPQKHYILYTFAEKLNMDRLPKF